MTFESFLENHWKVFLVHLCEFHKLEEDFIEKYKYELDWHALSRNQQIEWSGDFLERYAQRFSWLNLAENTAITWTTELIKRFKNRLDWYYLKYNRNLPISEEFIEKHRKNLWIVEDNIHLTAHLKELYGKELLPAVPAKPDLLHEEDLDHIEAIVKKLEKRVSRENSFLFYEHYILPNIAQNLTAIFEKKFDYSQRFFYMKPVEHDEFGLTPSFEFVRKNPFQYGFDLPRGIKEIEENLELRNSSSQEGKARLYEMPRFYQSSMHPVLLVSENVKAVLEQFELPEHSFTAVKLKPKKIKTDTMFYFLQFNDDTLTKDLVYDEVRFMQDTFEDGWKEFDDPIASYDELNEYVKTNRIFIYKPSAYVLKTGYDLYTCRGQGDFVVTEHLKKALETQLLNQVEFSSAQLANIKQDPLLYRKMAERELGMTAPIKQMESKTSPTTLIYREKMARLEKEAVVVSDELLQDDEFREVECELGVLIPDSFKKRFRNWSIDGYTPLAIAQFYLENGYVDKYPESFKSLIFAENGCGDALGLILYKNSDYKLKSQIYEFFHETGDIYKGVDGYLKGSML